MTSRCALAVVYQLARGLTLFSMREFIQRRPTAPKDVPLACEARAGTYGAAEAQTAVPATGGMAFLIAFMVFGAWVFGWSGLVSWWLLTGRGPGGRLVAAGAVMPRAYSFRRDRDSS